MTDIAPAWHVPVALNDIPENGLHVSLDAPEDVRVAAAALAGVRAVAALSGEFDLVRRGAGVRITGQVRARVEQACVVTLEAVETTVDEAVDLVFAPVSGEAARDDGAIDENAPEPLAGGQVDLGAIAIEFLVLGIDPYPRKLGVEFTPPETGPAGDHPFAALAALKKSPGA